MKKPVAKSAQKSRRAPNKPVASSNPLAPPKAKGEAAAASPSDPRFVRDLLVRGEAVKPDKQGKLPREATHGITEENPDGSAKAVRRDKFRVW
jgi:hypothetical protein